MGARASAPRQRPDLSELARDKNDGFRVSAPGDYWVCKHHSLHTRALRNGPLAGYAAPTELPRDPGPDRCIEVERPGELVQFDCFCVGRLAGTMGVV